MLDTDQIIALTAVVVAIISSIIGWRRWKRQNDERERPVIDTSGELDFTTKSFAVYLNNVGNIAGRITKIELEYKGEIVSDTNLIDIINNLFEEEKTIEVSGFRNRQVIPPNSQLTLFKFSFTDKSPPDAEIKDFLFNTGKVKIEYESLDGVKFEYSINKEKSI